MAQRMSISLLLCLAICCLLSILNSHAKLQPDVEVTQPPVGPEDVVDSGDNVTDLHEDDFEDHDTLEDDEANEGDDQPPPPTIPRGRKIKMMRALLRHIDNDEDEAVSADELKNWLIKMHDIALSRSLKSQIKSLDINNNSFVDFDEIRVTENVTNENNLQDLKHRFNAMDRSGDGELSYDELYTYLGMTMPDKYVAVESNYSFAVLDTDRDGKLNLTEFEKAKGGAMDDDLFTKRVQGTSSEDRQAGFAKLLKEFDLNNDSYLSRDELELFVKDSRVKELAEMESAFKTQAEDLIVFAVDQMMKANETDKIAPELSAEEKKSSKISFEDVLEKKTFKKWTSGLTDNEALFETPEDYLQEKITFDEADDLVDEEEEEGMDGAGLAEMLRQLMAGQGMDASSLDLSGLTDDKSGGMAKDGPGGDDRENLEEEKQTEMGENKSDQTDAKDEL